MRRHRGGVPERHLTSGPARLCQALQIDRSFNGADLVDGEELYLERGEPVGAPEVAAAPRIGVDYAHRRDRDALWRFYVASSSCVSTPRARPNQGR
jgi:DNA-3-methyladenine glycosylase